MASSGAYEKDGFLGNLPFFFSTSPVLSINIYLSFRERERVVVVMASSKAADHCLEIGVMLYTFLQNQERMSIPCETVKYFIHSTKIFLQHPKNVKIWKENSDTTTNRPPKIDKLEKFFQQILFPVKLYFLVFRNIFPLPNTPLNFKNG